MKISSARLANEQILEFGNFNVFIGGNGVGKTTVLTELFARVANTDRPRYRWIQELIYHSESVSQDMSLIKGTLRKSVEGIRSFYYSIAAKNADGNTDTNDNLRFSLQEFQEMERIRDVSVFQDVRYRRPIVSFMSCEGRLGLGNAVSTMAYNMPPTDPINALYRDKELLRTISESVLDRFGYHLVILAHSGTSLELGISRQQPPEADPKQSVDVTFESIETWKTQYFTPLTEAGHGVRSMIRLLISLLEPVNQVILIDEPEIHLYPRQKRWLGKQLVHLARSQHKQVFVVTHDPMILQGILDANTSTKIFRVDRNDDDEGVINVCDFDAIQDAGAIKNQEQYLQALFYQRCVIVEGASDRSFYSNMFDEYPELEDKDLGVVVSGGVGNSKHVAGIVSKIGLRASFVYDQDVLFTDPAVLQEIYKLLGGVEDVFNPLSLALDTIPEIASAANKDERWKMIKAHIGYTDKEGINIEWKAANEEAFNNTVQGLAKRGMFFVPNGSLESWVPGIEEKKRFAEIAPDVLRADAGLKSALREFAREVFRFVDIVLE